MSPVIRRGPSVTAATAVTSWAPHPAAVARDAVDRRCRHLGHS